MKAVVVFVLLFAVVYCHPVKRSASSSESSEEQSVTQVIMKFSDTTDVPSVVDKSEDTSDDDDDDDDDDNKESDDDDKDDTSESDESQETTSSPAFMETTLAIFVETGRGDSMGLSSDYKKSIFYEKGNYIEKEPSTYKSYEFKMVGADPTSKKTSNLKVYKALEVHDVLDHGMGISSGTISEDPSESEQADPQQDQKLKPPAVANNSSSSPESSEESSEETMPAGKDSVNIRTANIETANSDSADTSSQSSELPAVILTK